MNFKTLFIDPSEHHLTTQTSKFEQQFFKSNLNNVFKVDYVVNFFFQANFIHYLFCSFFFLAVFDESGYFVMYATMLGIKILNLHTNRISRIIGKVS